MRKKVLCIVVLFTLLFGLASIDSVRDSDVALGVKYKCSNSFSLNCSNDLVLNKLFDDNMNYSGYKISKKRKTLLYSIRDFDSIHDGFMFYDFEKGFVKSPKEVNVLDNIVNTFIETETYSVSIPENHQWSALIPVNNVNFSYLTYGGYQYGTTDVSIRYYQDQYGIDLANNIDYSRNFCAPVAAARIVGYYKSHSLLTNVWNKTLPHDHFSNRNNVNELITFFAQKMSLNVNTGVNLDKIEAGLVSPFLLNGLGAVRGFTSKDVSTSLYLIENKTPLLLNRYGINIGHSFMCNSYQINDKGEVFYGYYDNYFYSSNRESYILETVNNFRNFMFVAY